MTREKKRRHSGAVLLRRLKGKFWGQQDGRGSKDRRNFGKEKFSRAAKEYEGSQVSHPCHRLCLVTWRSATALESAITIHTLVIYLGSVWEVRRSTRAPCSVLCKTEKRKQAWGKPPVGKKGPPTGNQSEGWMCEHQALGIHTDLEEEKNV